MTPPLWLTRTATPADLGYVWRTLGAQLARRDAQRWREQPGGSLHADLVRRRELTVARYLLAEAFCTVAFPAAAESAHIVCAFAVFDPLISTVHYVYTARNYRRLGIASGLLAEVLQPHEQWETIHASHLTRAGGAFAARLKLRVRFDPYRAFFSRDHFTRAHGRDDERDGEREIGQRRQGGEPGQGQEGAGKADQARVAPGVVRP